MLEDLIHPKGKVIIANAFIDLYEKTDALFTLNSFNVFDRKYFYKHAIDETKGYVGRIMYLDRRADVFKRYVRKIAYDYIKNGKK